MAKRIVFSTKSIPFLLLAVCLIGYLPFIHRLGFYWDDWPSIWFLHLFGPSSFVESFSIDRPLLAWPFMLTTPLFGESMLGWQLFGVFTRWIASLALFWTLLGVWPRHTAKVAWIAILFAVYPGFSQQFISVTYGNAFLIYICFLFSLGTMVWAIRSSQGGPTWLYWPLTVLSWSSAALTLFTSEYFFGMELLRPALLWLVLQENNLPRTRRMRLVAVKWAPYLAIMIAFLIWRILLYKTPRAEIVLFEQILRNPFWATLKLAWTILSDFFEVTFIPWARSFNFLPIQAFDTLLIQMYIATVVGTLLLSGIFMYIVRQPGDQPGGSIDAPSKTWARQAMAIGGLALLAGGWPVWVTNLHIELIFPWDRFTLVMMVGVCTLLVGLVEWIARKTWQSTLFLAMLTGFAAGMQFQYRLAYRQDWVTMKAFFWELSWRAPDLQPGTVLLTNELPFRYYTDNSLTAPLNWMYAPNQNSQQMPYLIFDIEARLGKGLPVLEAGIPIHEPYRATSFDGTTSQALVLFYDPPRCLRVVNPRTDLSLPYKPEHIPEALPLSRTDLIVAGADPPASPPAAIFGLEPRGWCYFFEKAELARQVGDWELVAKLGDQGIPLKKKFTKETATELLTFVEGYARTGQWEKALRLSSIFYEATDKSQSILCQTWYRILKDTPPSKGQESAVAQLEEMLKCDLP